MNTQTLTRREAPFAASALPRRLFVGACFSFAAMASAQTTSISTDDETIKLETFTVNTSQDVGYRAANSVSATKVDTAIKDLPFSVSAFTSQFIKDTDSIDLFDVVRYSAGVTNGSREFNAGAAGYMIRGFQQYPQHDGFFSGNQADIYVDTATIDRVEVVKGPASLLYGQISPGGTVNYITKRAEETPFVNAGAQYGSYDFARATVDLNQPLIAKKLLFRFNGAWENGYQYLKDQKSRQWVIDPTVTWNIEKNLSLKVNYSWFQKKETPPGIYRPNIDLGTPAAITAGFAAPFPSTTTAGLTNNKNLLGVPNLGPVSGVANTTAFAPTVDVGFLSAYPALARTFNTAAKNDYRNTDLESLNGELDGKFGDHWVGRSNFVYAWNRSVQQTTGIGTVALAPPGSLTYNTGTGKWTTSAAWTALTAVQQAAATYAFAQQILANPNAALQPQTDQNGNAVGAPAVISRRSRWIETDGHEDTVASDLAGQYDFSWGKLKPVFGFYYDAQYQYTLTRASTGTAASPFSRTWDVDPNSPTYYVNQNDYVSPATVIAEGIQLSSSTSLAYTTDSAIYGLLNGSFLNDHLQVTGGLRYNRSSEWTQNLVPTAPPLFAPQVQSPGEKGIHDLTPQLGAGYKIAKDIMIYASYSESYTLATQSSLRVASTPMFPAPPTTSKGYETGIKTDLFDGRVSSTLAVYRIDQKNAVLTLNGFTAAGATSSTDFETSVRSQGLEYEITYSPLDNWQIFGSVAEDDIRVRSFSDPNPADPAGLYNILIGEHPQGTAKTLANLWTRYSFTGNAVKGLWVGGGFNYNGASLADNRNPYFFLPSYWIYNSAVGYDWAWHKIGWSATVNWNNMANKQYSPANQETGLPERIEVSVAAKF
jgi:iron complex outermembrane receptor protein